ncbi:type III effector protein [Kribbella capetownensis]|uniref:Type III effector protein n=1 Tax=Kribbella capetownensis TaxID=1572659 RepID=A0A4R0IXW3_9ACTN|nr:type III effector protein [Kribbella capetownensis]TCC37484.1 type III effector protein [Kribbella capetownensis]
MENSQLRGLLDGLELLEAPEELEQAEAPELLAALGALSRLRTSLDHWEPALIESARFRGLTWAQIAPALGLASRQAAERRYLRLKPQAADRPGTTREHRVDATRNLRSADRAVADWARGNAASLRQVAGLITALPRDSANRSAVNDAIDRVRAVLGSDDAAELVQPLADAARCLRATHPDLADQISTLTRATDKIRDADLARRTTPGGIET